MFSVVFRAPCRLGLFVTLCGLVAVLPGCQAGSAKLTPVTGQVTVDGKPLTAGNVTFKPNKDKGNTFGGEPTSEINSSGEYTLTTKGKPGAPLGWYKVIVPAMEPPDQFKPPSYLVNKKYIDVATTPLEVEVVASPAPGAYDLKCTR